MPAPPAASSGRQLISTLANIITLYMKPILAIILVILIGGISTKLYLDNRDFSQWMTPKEIDAYFKPMTTKDANGIFKLDSILVTDLQSRWHDGYSQYRVRINKSPRDMPAEWEWRFNLDHENLIKEFDEMQNKRYRVVSFSYYTFPEGTARYCVLWHRIGKQ